MESILMTNADIDGLRKIAFSEGELDCSNKVQEIIGRGCAQKKCTRCNFRGMDGCKEMYTIAQIEQFIEDLQEGF